MISGRWTSGNKQKIIGSRISKITAHPVFLTTDTRKSEKGILCVILRKNTGSSVCIGNCETSSQS